MMNFGGRTETDRSVIGNVAGVTASMPRLIATDLDGTLLNEFSEISPRTQAALQLAADSGAIVVLASGRPHALVLDYLDGSEIAHYYVGTNGGSVHRVATGEQMWEATFPASDARALIEVIRVQLPGARFGMFTELGGGYEAGFAERLPAAPGLPIVDSVDDVTGETVSRLGIFHMERHVNEYLPLIRHLAPAGIDIVYSGLDLAEVLPTGVDKSTALDRLAGELGIDPADAVVFGDNLNDIGMIRWAGRSFAMENADPTLFEMVTDRAGHHALDGVAIEIEKLFANL
jgi:hydroxymethylpyrimidine pyrophosphatase-like HAD family hydrolase